MAKTPNTRSGRSAARTVQRPAPLQSPPSTTLSAPTWSSTAQTSSRRCWVVICSGPVGRSDRPLPRGSTVTTRKCRARNATWAFQARACTMVSGMTRQTVTSPSPYTA